MAVKYIGDTWQLKWSDIYSSQVVVLYKIGIGGTWVQITDIADNGIDGDNYSGEYNWIIDLLSNELDVYVRVADKDLWDSENPDDGEYIDFGPFDIEERVITTIVVSPSSARVIFNGQKQFTAVAYDQTGTALEVQPEFTFSTDSLTTTVNSQGLLTAGGVEEVVTVTATADGVSGTASVRVQQFVDEGNKSSMDTRGSFTRRRTKWRGL